MRIVAYKGQSFFSKAITRFTDGPYSHVALMLDSGEIVEAYPGKGVRRRSGIFDGLSNNPEADVFILTKQIDDQSVEEFLNRQIGKKYDWSLITRFVTHTNESRKLGNKWICSEIVFASIWKGGLKLLERIDAWKVHPSLIPLSPYLRLEKTVKAG